MCYPGQNFDMSVPVPEGTALDETGLLDLAERFHDQHQPTAASAFRNQQPLLRGVRLTARGRTPKPDRLAELGAVTDADAGAARARAPRVLRRRVRRHAGVRRRRARGRGRGRGAGADRGAVHRRRRAAGFGARALDDQATSRSPDASSPIAGA